jgi:phosphoesterase RecJ-like protein
MQPIKEIYPLLQVPRKIVITTHQKPDADAMGSSLGLYHFLLPFGHEVKVISPTNWASFLNWMPGCNEVLDYERETDQADQLINDADWIFCLDFNTLSRIKRMETKLKQSAAKLILIDHHQEFTMKRDFVAALETLGDCRFVMGSRNMH